MGFGFFAVLRVYDKSTKEKKYTEISPDRYKIEKWSYTFRVPKEYLDDEKYYVNITAGTCDDPNQMSIKIDGKYYGTTNCSYDDLSENELKYLQKGNHVIIKNYNKIRINMPTLQSQYVVVDIQHAYLD
ncbi:hypothetical protein MYSEV_296 [Mythimna separata entomopoxvirus 'L']|uniref:Uncharacterized protein n=1 Tax=Mythimna separata entomopoxvirus 'L' TaxID=1293572 RepID=A0A916KQK6_9POXV|nr:hypothetical protein MYSEV_296 [Mythimna separata entomopoxvirus 'L']CCU56494.1 hypothetical protein MYSEV_296 [Mythimna separata entomopoxvirus 'L']